MVGRQNADTADTLHIRDFAVATTFWLLMGYNFGFLGSSYPMKTADFEVLRDVAMATIFGSLYMWYTLAPPGKYD